jgi:hypothetical protein
MDDILASDELPVCPSLERKTAIAKILNEICLQFRKGNISGAQRSEFKERVLVKSSSLIDLRVLLSEVQVYEEGPEVI